MHNWALFVLCLSRPSPHSVVIFFFFSRKKEKESKEKEKKDKGKSKRSKAQTRNYTEDGGVEQVLAHTRNLNGNLNTATHIAFEVPHTPGY